MKLLLVKRESDWYFIHKDKALCLLSSMKQLLNNIDSAQCNLYKLSPTDTRRLQGIVVIEISHNPLSEPTIILEKDLGNFVGTVKYQISHPRPSEIKDIYITKEFLSELFGSFPENLYICI